MYIYVYIYIYIYIYVVFCFTSIIFVDSCFRNNSPLTNLSSFLVPGTELEIFRGQTHEGVRALASAGAVSGGCCKWIQIKKDGKP